MAAQGAGVRGEVTDRGGPSAGVGTGFMVVAGTWGWLVIGVCAGSCVVACVVGARDVCLGRSTRTTAVGVIDRGRTQT